MINAVIIGFSHMHVNEIALYISEHPDYNLVGIADAPTSEKQTLHLRYTRGWNIENVKQNYCQSFYDNYLEMLDLLKPDIAFILCENNQKHIVVKSCAERGINVSIEKPVSDSYENALIIKEAVEKSHIQAYVNWPVMWREYVHRMKAAIDSGLLGEPIKLRYINGHTGPLGKGAKHRGVSEKAEEMTDADRAKTWWHSEQCGGGVFLDIACYGCFFAEWFLGKGNAVISSGANLNTPYGDTDDNFAAVIKYDRKMAVIEGTWTTPRAVIPSGPMMIMTNGVIVCTGGAENMPDVKAYDIYGNEVLIPDIKLDDSYKNIAWQYANYVVNGKAVDKMLCLDENLKVMAMLDAVITSAETNKEEPIA